MNNSEVVLHKDGGITLAGPDAVAFGHAVTLRAALKLWLKARIIVNSRVTVKDLLRVATNITHVAYPKSTRENVALAIEDLSIWIDTMRAALPVDDRR